MSLAIPESTLIITLTAISLGFVSNLATRLLVDLKKEKRVKAEVAAFDKELKEAAANKEKDKEEKLKKKKPQMDQMRLKASTGRFKVILVTWVPLLLIYYFMASVIGGCAIFSGCGFSVTVAYTPIPFQYILGSLFGPNGSMGLFVWYFFSSLSFSTVLTRLMGTAPT